MSMQRLPFLEVFKDASGGNIKTPQRDFLEEGEIPVVDQGQQPIAGYVNDRSRVCKAKPPVIVFGDHTKTIKYVDFQIAMGADGTKVLIPKIESDLKYLFYALRFLHIPDAGYSRHYKFLKETKISLPPLAEQKRIAAILDAADALRARRRETLAQLDTLLQSTFLDMFGDPVTNPKGFPIKNLSEFYISKREGTKCGPFGSALKKDELVTTGIPVWNMDNIDPSGRMILPFRMWITEKMFRNLEPYKVIDGDIIISRAGTAGKMCVVNELNTASIISTNLIRVRFGSTP